MSKRSALFAKLHQRQQELDRQWPELRQTYRGLAYARAQTEALAAQLRAEARK